MTMNQARCVACGMVLVLCAVVSTASQARSAAEAAPAPAPEPLFAPATFVSALHFEKGDRKDLLSSDSYAVWAGAEVAALRRSEAAKQGVMIAPGLETAAARINENFLVFECHISSQFKDAKIAQEAVDFRNTSVYLLVADGQHIAPIQIVPAALAPTEQHGAVKQPSRVNLVIFRSRDLWRDTPTIPVNTPAARLVIEGHGSVFYFEWPASKTPARAWTPSQEETARVLNVGFRGFYEPVFPLTRLLD